MTQDGPPTRRLHPVEPPYPDDRTRPAPYDHQAEQAVLATLLTHPENAATIEDNLEPADFYRPEHETIWATWHQLATADGVPPDAITLNAALIQARQANAVRALTDITIAPSDPILLDQYVTIVRNHARIRTAQAAHARIGQALHAATPDNLDRAFGDALDTIEAAALRFGPRDAGPSKTGLADLSWILNGQPPEVAAPVYGRRTDGTALFYAGRVNGVFGDPECGKTWLAQVAGIEAMHDGDMFAMVDVDHNGQDHTAARLLLLGARPEHIADPTRFRYYEPEDADQLHAAIADITALAPAVVVLDSLGEILPMLGVKSIDNDEITAALRSVAMPPAKAGSCVIHIDHLPKSVEARSTGYAIGGTAKKRSVDGAYLRAEARQQPAPGSTGRVTLRIEKDRTGALRKSSGGGFAGTFTLNSTQDDITTWTIGRDEMPTNADGTFRPTGYMEKVAHFVASNEGCTSNDIEAGIAGTAKHIRSALTILVTEGHISRSPGPRRSWLHTLTIPYREAEDDNAQPTL